MKQGLIIFLTLFSFTTFQPKLNSISDIKTVKFIDESDDIYEENDYEYDGFLENVFAEANMDENDTQLTFIGCTTIEYGTFDFNLSFDIDTLAYEYDFSDSGIDVCCDCATIDDEGRLEAEIVIDNVEKGETEIYLLSDYKDIEDLENFVLNPEEYSANVQTIAIGSLPLYYFEKIAAIISGYTIISETAEQVKARKNYQENTRLEESGDGVSYGNYITNQAEKSEVGYKSAEYKFGFTTFASVGCEVAAVYNLMISEDLTQNLSDVIYNFEKWGIEFAVGWGTLGSNPCDIYRYLLKFNIRYSRNTSYFIFKLKVNMASTGTKFIMSSWNNGISGLHTYFFIKREDGLETYNFNEKSETDIFKKFDSLYSNTGLFIVGYKIYE